MAGRGRMAATVTAISITGIALLAVALGFWFFFRLDLTSNSRYSLSRTSREIARSMDSLDVQVYISDDLPTSMLYKGRQIDIRGFDRELLDRLGEFRSWVGSGMTINVVRGDIEERAEAARLELFSWKDAEIRGGQFALRKYALGAVFTYRDQAAVLPIVTDPESLEFEITRILSRLKEGNERSATIKPFITAAREIQQAAAACNGKLESYRKERDTNAGLEVLLGKGDALRDALESDIGGFARACGAVGASIAASMPNHGSNELLDQLLRSARLYEEAVDRLVSAITGTASGAGLDDADLAGMVQRLETVFRAVDKDASNLIDLPSTRTVAFMCGHREFCPADESVPVIEPGLASALSKTNPTMSSFVGLIEQTRNQINVVNSSLRFRMFQDRGIKPVFVSAGQEIPDDADALVLFGPAMPIPEADRYRIDQFLMSGRSVVVFVNAWDVALFNIDEGSDLAAGQPVFRSELQARTSNLSTVLEPYGVRVRGDLVAGRKSYAQMRTGQPGVDARSDRRFAYPLLPFFSDIDKTHVLVRSLPGIVLPWATTLEVSTGSGKDRKQTITELVRTSSDATVIDGPVDIIPERLVEQVSRIRPKPPAPVVVAVTGEFRSAFDQPPENFVVSRKPHIGSGSGRLLVVGSSMGLENLSTAGILEGFSIARITEGKSDLQADYSRFAARFINWQLRYTQLSGIINSNMDFVYNCLDWGVQNEALAEIRSKGADSRPLPALSRGAVLAWQFGLIIGLPVAFGLLGLARWSIRRRRV
ncbi:Gldg family protein [Myxococcota bacterium]|nr:Gldg family protein [Myxococcota bacterium]